MVGRVAHTEKIFYIHKVSQGITVSKHFSLNPIGQSFWLDSIKQTWLLFRHLTVDSISISLDSSRTEGQTLNRIHPRTLCILILSHDTANKTRRGKHARMDQQTLLLWKHGRHLLHNKDARIWPSMVDVALEKVHRSRGVKPLQLLPLHILIHCVCTLYVLPCTHIICTHVYM